MRNVTEQIWIAAPAGAVFDLAQDYQLRLEWDPFLKAMRFRNGATEAAVGIRVWVRARNGLTMEVEYITLRRPDLVAMRMVDGPRLFKRFAGSWRFHSEDGGTRVVFRYGFKARWLRSLIEPIVALILARNVRQRLLGLKEAIERFDLLERLPGALACAPPDAAN